MAVTDSHDNALNKLSVTEEENPQKLTSPEHDDTAMRKRKRKKRNEESKEQSQVEVGPTPSVDSLFSQGNVEAASDNSQSTSKKKKKIKNVRGEQQLQTSDPSIAVSVESDDTKGEGARLGDANENGGLYPNSLLDTRVPIVPHGENAEGTALNSGATAKKKRKKKILQGGEQIYDTSIRIGVEPDVTKDDGSREGDVNENGGLCPKPLLDTPIPIVSNEENAEATAQNPSPTPKKKRKKKILQSAEQICDPSIGVEPDVAKDDGSQEGDVNENGGLCPKPLLDTPIPIVFQEENAEATTQNPSPTPKKKRKKKILQGAEQICDTSIPIGVGHNVTNDDGSQEGDVNENGDLRPKPLLDTPIPVVSHEENAEATAQNSTPTPKKKRKKKILQGAEQICHPSIPIGVGPDVAKDEGSREGDVNENGGLCPKPLLDIRVPIVSHEENDEGTALNTSPSPKKKRTKKILQGEEQICDASIQTGVDHVLKDEGSREADVNENGGLCPKPLLDIPVPIVSHEENAEGTALNTSPSPKKKRKEKILQGAEQICDPSIPIGVEQDVTKADGSQEGDVNENGGLCPKPLLDTPFPIVFHEENAEGTALNPSPIPKKKRNKKILQGAEQMGDPSIQIGVEPEIVKDEGSREDVNENEGLCPKALLGTPISPIPIDPLEENAEATAQNPSPILRKRSLQGAEQICDPSIWIGVESDVTNEEGSQRGDATGNGFCPKTLLDSPLPIVPPEENAQRENLQGAEQILIGVESDVPKEGGQQGFERAETSKQNPNRTPKRKRRKNVQGEQQQIYDPSIAIDVEPDFKKEGAQQVNANEVGVSGTSEECPVPDSTAPEDKHQKKDSARKKKKALKPQGAEAESQPELKESNKTENPQQCTPELKLNNKMKKEAGANAENSGLCSKTEMAPQLYIAAATDLELKEKAEKVNKEHPQACSKPALESPIDMPTQITPQKKKKKKKARKGKKKETGLSKAHEGAESNEADGKPPETPVQGFLHPVVPLSIDPTIPVQASPKDTATVIVQGQKMIAKKRKSNSIAAPSIEPTIQTGQDPPVDPATPVDPEQTPKKKRRKNSAQKDQRLESEKHNAHPTAETPVQKTKGRTTTKKTAETPVQKTKGPTTTKKSMVRRRIHIVSSVVVFYVAEISKII